MIVFMTVTFNVYSEFILFIVRCILSISDYFTQAESCSFNALEYSEMNTQNVLELTIVQILCAVKPLRGDWVMRKQIIDHFQTVVESIDSLRGSIVEPFGSFVSNLFSKWGDLDISIELQNGSYISSAGRKQKQNLLREVLKVLRRMDGCRGLKFICNARVPILKFETTFQNISCDVSINNLIGKVKSKILFWISEIDGRFRDMVLLVKEWAKAHDINNSKSGTLNSYSLCLLIIFHFQTCVPAILPPLREIYPGNIVDDLTGVRSVAEGRIDKTCHANIAKFKSDQLRTVNRSSLSELFLSFLAKFRDISSMADEQGICVYTGQWEEINSNMRWLPKTYAILVEDPFEQPQNSARTVSSNQLCRISEVFEITHRRLLAPSQNQSALLATLAGPQVAHALRSHAGSVGGNPRIRPPSYRAPNSPAQVRRQFPGPRNAIHPGSSTFQRPPPAVQNKVQQIWRPRT